MPGGAQSALQTTTGMVLRFFCHASFPEPLIGEGACVVWLSCASFNLASLGDQGAVFASASLGDEGHEEEEDRPAPEPSVIFFRLLAGNYSNRNQWLYTLPRGESALSVAIGEGWAAVATNRKLVRIFSFR